MSFEKNAELYNQGRPETKKNEEIEKEEEKFLGMFDKSRARKIAYIMSLMTMFSLGAGHRVDQAGAREIKTGDKKEQKLNQEQLNNLKSVRKEAGQESISTQFNWEEFAINLSKRPENSPQKLEEIFQDIWGDDFSSSVVYVDSKEIQGSYDFSVSGLYSSQNDKIKFSKEFLSQVNNKESALKFWDLAFHESGHADHGFDKFESLQNISEELGLENKETYRIIQSSEILEKKKREAFQNEVYVNDILNETYASFAEVYGGIKAGKKIDFPTEKYLAEASLFNKISSSEMEKDFYGHKSLNSSTYSGVEFFSVLLMKRHGNDLEELRKILKSSTREEMSQEIIEAFKDFQKEKAGKMSLDLKGQSPADIYQSLEKGRNDHAPKEEEAVSEIYSQWTEDLCRQNNLKSDLAQEKIKSLKKNKVFAWLATYAQDEIGSLEDYCEHKGENKNISRQESELLGVVKDFYQYLFQLKGKPDIQKLREKINKTKAELEVYKEKDDFSSFYSRIDEEKNNLEKFYNNLNTGGFNKRS